MNSGSDPRERERRGGDGVRDLSLGGSRASRLRTRSSRLFCLEGFISMSTSVDGGLLTTTGSDMMDSFLVRVGEDIVWSLCLFRIQQYVLIDFLLRSCRGKVDFEYMRNREDR